MSEAAYLLAELASVDEVSAWIPSNADHVQGVTPEWCELVLEVTRSVGDPLAPDFPINARMPLRRADGELIMQVLNDVLRPDMPTMAGDLIWRDLDAVVERIQKVVNKGKTPSKSLVGQALGLATALAYLDNALDPDVDEVRATAMTRYAIRHGLDVSDL